MKKIILLIIFALIAAFNNIPNVKADYIDFIGGQRYNYYENFTYTGITQLKTLYFTGSNLYIKDIFCRNLNDLTSYNSYLQFYIIKTPFASQVFTNTGNIAKYMPFNSFGSHILNINTMVPDNLIIGFNSLTNTLSNNPRYTGAYLGTQCFINGVLFNNNIPNMNDNIPISELVFDYTMAIINILLIIILYLSPYFIAFYLAKYNYFTINNKENEKIN